MQQNVGDTGSMDLNHRPESYLQSYHFPGRVPAPRGVIRAPNVTSVESGRGGNDDGFLVRASRKRERIDTFILSLAATQSASPCRRPTESSIARDKVA